MNKQLTTIVLSRYFVQISFILPIIVIPLGFEPKTHSLEGCCSNPTELRNQHCHFSLASAKVILFCESTKYFGIFFSFISILRKFFIARASSSIIFKAFALTGRRAKATKKPGCYSGDV